MPSPSSAWLIGIIGAVLICLQLWSSTQAGNSQRLINPHLLQRSIEDLKKSQDATRSEVHEFKQLLNRYLGNPEALKHIAQLNEARPTNSHRQKTAPTDSHYKEPSPTNSNHNKPTSLKSHHDEAVSKNSHEDDPAHAELASPSNDKECHLPQLANIVSERRKHGACLWWPHKEASVGSSCSYVLEGTCKRVFHKESGCTFFGWRSNEQYQPSDFVLPDRVEGEIELTAEEETMLRSTFEKCEDRPRFFMVSQSLLHDGRVVNHMGTTKKPLVLMAGGSAGIAQHFCFVVGEVAGADSYRLGWQKESDIKVVVDIGANIGLFSISVCIRFPNARIIAFEPHPGNFRFLKYNLKAAGCEERVEAYNKGVSSDGRSMKLYWHDSIGTSAFRKSLHYVPMQTIVPDRIFEIVGADKVSLMKIDCEGCEYEVIPLLQLPRIEQLFCEVHSPSIYQIAMKTSVWGNAKETHARVKNTCKAGNRFGVFVPA